MNDYTVRIVFKDKRIEKVNERMSERELKTRAEEALTIAAIEAVVASKYEGRYTVYDRDGERTIDFA